LILIPISLRILLAFDSLSPSDFDLAHRGTGLHRHDHLHPVAFRLGKDAKFEQCGRAQLIDFKWSSRTLELYTAARCRICAEFASLPSRKATG